MLFLGVHVCSQLVCASSSAGPIACHILLPTTETLGLKVQYQTIWVSRSKRHRCLSFLSVWPQGCGEQYTVNKITTSWETLEPAGPFPFKRVAVGCVGRPRCYLKPLAGDQRLSVISCKSHRGQLQPSTTHMMDDGYFKLARYWPGSYSQKKQSFFFFFKLLRVQMQLQSKQQCDTL